jgi:seryl-tRNA synthetase
VAGETQIGRVEKKVDELQRSSIEQSAALGEIRQAIEFQARQTAQVNELVKDKVGRVEKALDEEKEERQKAIAALKEQVAKDVDGARQETAAVKTTLGRVAMALFTALLSLVVAAVLYVVTH